MLLCLPVRWQERNLGGAQCQEWAYINNGPVGDPDASLRLYDFLKENKLAIKPLYDWHQHSRQLAAAVGATSIAIVQPACRLQAERRRSIVK